jgi:endonuclease/exonuclease/phosphatase (EEP) superfamily protein YafD
MTRSLSCALVLLLSACVSLNEQPRTLVYSVEGRVEAQSLDCASANRKAKAPPPRDASALDSSNLRVLTWNIHKQADKGWQTDLARFVESSDLLLLQEVTLEDRLRAIVESARLRWVMASSFLIAGQDIGVLTASRVMPIATCTERIVEPLIRLPKSAVIAWFDLSGTPETLAVVNVHGINFSVSLAAYRAQFAALGDALMDHRGPIIFAGDLNTWTEARSEAVAQLAQRLGLTEIAFETDQRTLFFGKQLDHIFIRGLTMRSSVAFDVKSSDHNPVSATLRLSNTR